MKSLRDRRYRRARAVEINMAPLIDMIFILLIFFLVTTSFVKESGVEIERPTARSAAAKEKINLKVGITAEGAVHIEGAPIDIRSVRARMKRFVAETPGGSVVLVADRTSATGDVIRVLDECRLAGVQNISIAAKEP